MVKMDSQVWEAYRLFYQKNQDYHDAKERMLWLAGTVYFSFSIVIVGWILLPGHTITDVQKGWFTGFVSALGLAVFFFAYIQNWWKCQAAHVDVLMTDWLSQKANSKSSLKDVCEVKKYPHTTFREMVCYSFRYGKPGIVILFALLIFAAAQISFLWIK